MLKALFTSVSLFMFSSSLYAFSFAEELYSDFLRDWDLIEQQGTVEDLFESPVEYEGKEYRIAYAQGTCVYGILFDYHLEENITMSFVEKFYGTNRKIIFGFNSSSKDPTDESVISSTLKYLEDKAGGFLYRTNYGYRQKLKEIPDDLAEGYIDIKFDTYAAYFKFVRDDHTRLICSVKL